MSRPAEELVRPWQLPASQPRIPIDATLTSGKTSITKADVIPGQGGGGYSVDDTIIPAGGAGIAAILRVAEIVVDPATGASNGEIAKLSIDSGGSYTIAPITPAYQKSTSGSGSGAQFDLGGAGGAATVKVTIGGVGKLPSPVSDSIGISICDEAWEEIPNTRTTHNDQVTDNSSGAFITVARTTGAKFKKANNENMLGSTNWSYAQDVGVALAEMSANFTPLAGSGFQSASDSRTGKCNINMKMHNPA